MKLFIFVAALLAIGSMLLFAQNRAVPMPMDFDKAHPAYTKGVNDALDAITLLSSEQLLEGTNRTWDAMAEVICERLQVERRK